MRGEKRLGRAQKDFLILVTFIDPTVQKDNFLLSSPQKIPVMNAVKHELSACFDFVEHSVQNERGKKNSFGVRSHKIASKDIMFEMLGFPATRHIQALTARKKGERRLGKCQVCFHSSCKSLILFWNT